MYSSPSPAPPLVSSKAINLDFTAPPMSKAKSFFGAAGCKKLHEALDLAIVELFAVNRLALNMADSKQWTNLLKLTAPAYKPASRTKLMDVHMMSEQSRVAQLQIEQLRTERRVSISFDGGSTRAGDSLYTVHATPVHINPLFDGVERRPVSMLLDGQECTDISPTGKWLADMVDSKIEAIGPERIVAFSADNTGNTRVAREILSQRHRHVLNMPDPQHHINNTWKDISNIPYIKDTGTKIRRSIKVFSKSNHKKALLRDARIERGIGAGLETVGKTRFTSEVWSGFSLERNLSAIRDLVTSGKIDLLFEIRLTQFLAVGRPFACAIQCLEAASANPADVYLYWLAIIASVKRALETCQLPDDVCGQIRGIINSRWQEFFIDGPTNAHLCAFYLHPDFVRSDIFKNPNPLSFKITLPARNDESKPKVPPGIRSPKTFLEVGTYLHTLLVNEFEHGFDAHLAQFKNKASALIKAYQAQFTAYAQGTYPFNVPLGPGQTPLQWWAAFENTANGGILAAIAIKLFSIVPHSMADERTMSYITMLNTAQKNRQKVGTIVAMTQIRGHVLAKEPPKLRKSSRPNPLIKFYDVKRLMRSIDDDSRYDDPNYDESEPESEDESTATGKTKADSPACPHKVASTLPEENPESDFNMGAIELEDILADSPVKRKVREKVASEGSIAEDDGGDDVGGTFELGAWV
ncbi:hypothetical protein D9613_005661 [Agrocybe pediades]|uniref:DUF659 domain-containing protein n=1 Tax=Agrocybe pediades TaxID=84607 RepID=A0A8H4QV61_9AGAR|nr:hypothetical protein D9613_005661 [Agrocybe pediades]